MKSYKIEADEHRELVQRTKDGDEGAFGQLYAIHKNYVQVLCFRIVHNTAEAEELTQEVFMRVFRHIQKFRGDSRFNTWLHRIAINVVLEALRKKKSRPDPVSLDELIEKPEGEVIRQAVSVDRHQAFTVYRITFQSVLEKLSADDRMLIVLFYVDGYTHSEIALMFGLSLMATKARMFRAKLELISLLKVTRNPLAFLVALDTSLSDGVPASEAS